MRALRKYNYCGLCNFTKRLVRLANDDAANPFLDSKRNNLTDRSAFA